MKTYILPILSLIFLASCASGLSSLESTQWFSISYPSSYTAGKDTSIGGTLREKDSGVIIVAKKFPITQDYQKSNETVTEFYKKNAPLDTNGSIKFGPKDGAYVSWTKKIGNFSTIHKDAWIIEKDSLYTVACTIPEKSKDKGMQDCDVVIGSFSIK